MHLYLTGADGMLGSALTAALADHPLTRDWSVRGVSMQDFDIADTYALGASMREFEPDVVVHTAANAIVDDCEADPRSALRVNIQGTSNVAAECRALDVRMVYISSDYVFDGAAPPADGYNEDDVPNPLSVYGLTKLGGERIAQTVPRHLSLRTSWLFGGRDERTDMALAAASALARGQQPRLVSDQFSRPTYTIDLARALIRLLTVHQDLTGVVHVASAGLASWYDVGQVLAEELCRLGVTSVQAPEPTSFTRCGFVGGRPRDSSLATTRFDTLAGALPHWSDAVRRYCAELLREGLFAEDFLLGSEVR